MAAGSGGGTPGPLSDTEIAAQPSRSAAVEPGAGVSPSRRSVHRTVPPGGVNLNALESRFASTRWIIPGSTSAGAESGTSTVNADSRSAASASKCAAVWRTRRERSADT